MFVYAHVAKGKSKEALLLYRTSSEAGCLMAGKITIDNIIQSVSQYCSTSPAVAIHYGSKQYEVVSGSSAAQ